MEFQTKDIIYECNSDNVSDGTIRSDVIIRDPETGYISQGICERYSDGEVWITSQNDEWVENAQFDELVADLTRNYDKDNEEGYAYDCDEDDNDED